jgi:hypothetical protein
MSSRDKKGGGGGDGVVLARVEQKRTLRWLGGAAKSHSHPPSDLPVTLGRFCAGIFLVDYQASNLIGVSRCLAHGTIWTNALIG